MTTKYCKHCSKILKKEKEGKNNYYSGRCRRCYNKINMEIFNKRKWKKLGGVKPKPYYKGKGMSSGIMDQKTCQRITRTVESINFKVGRGYRIIVYEGKDNYYHVQMYSSKYNQEKWWKFKTYGQVNIFIELIKGYQWKKL